VGEGLATKGVFDPPFPIYTSWNDSAHNLKQTT